MKTWMLLALAACSLQASAQSAGYYEPLRYRSNDPFLFCTKGQQNADKCWVPLPPYTGAYMMMPYCDPPNTYGKPWTQADYDSLQQYQSVCPRADNSGNWEGRGQPESTPFTH
jgi:hypothetical protein